MAAVVRRVGAENSATRALIIKTTEELILEQGYAAVSTRRVATKAGLKPSLVHYYFPTTDDLLLAVGQRGAGESDRLIEEALRSENPLRALWQFLLDTSRTALALEYMAMANHREAIRTYIAEHAEYMRKRQIEILTKLYGDRIDGPCSCSPAALSVVLAGIGRVLVMEGGLGIATGHEEARLLVEQWLDALAVKQGEQAKNQV